MKLRARLVVAMLVGILVLTGCAAPIPAGGGAARSEPTSAPKSMVIAVMGEPPGFISELYQGASVGAGAPTATNLGHNGLVYTNDQDTRVAQLAADVISVQAGTWRLNNDGTMETTWRLRPNVKWHDGAALTADDFLFAFTVFKDPDLPNTIGQPLRLMQSAAAPDPLTIVVRWSSAYVSADQAPGLVPMPRHLLEPIYRESRTNFASSPILSTEWVGLGPYRLTHWEPGVQLEFARFDEYFMGRPRFDTVIMRLFTDPNAMVANILAGVVDVILPVAVDIPQAIAVQRIWEGTGNQVLFPPRGSLRHLEIQHRPDFEEPKDTSRNRIVRQALYHAIDRQTLVEVVTEGITPVADSWIPPNHELRSQVKLPQFPYDLNRSRQLLAMTDWERGPDGTLVRKGTGERFEILLYGSNVGSTEAEVNTIAAGWKAVGVQPKFYVIPTALSSDREHRAKLPGLGLNGIGFDAFTSNRLHSREIPSDANRWNGNNRGGYVNPCVDAILDKLVVTIDPGERVTQQQQLADEQMGDVALMPLYWNADPVLALKGVRGLPSTEGKGATRTIFNWDKD